ncbi:MAG: type pilus assembly protein PilB, partial [Patescibacteria group bacterium]|nr:type pilus assembly protein PilB [Patescibacteria group bacterium]
MSFLNQLVEQGKLAQEAAAAIEQEASDTGRSLEDVARSKGVPNADILGAKGVYYGLPTRPSIDPKSISFDILNQIPEESARHYRLVPIGMVDGALEVGVVDPDNTEAKDALQFISAKTGLPYKLFLISQNDYEKVLENYQGLSGEVTEALTDLESELNTEQTKSLKRARDEKNGVSEEDTIVEDAPVTKIVATVLNHAVEQNASDIHIEPTDEMLKIRFRVDGVMSTNLTLPMNVHPAIIARIKILSNMKIDEKRKPQDGRFSAHIGGRKIDLRVSTFPAYYGEKVVMRILDPDKGVLPLDKIGMSERDLRLVRNAIKRPYGLILISGPTGSGKTTTLYSMLEEVDREAQNVLSLEDPVEYNISGMNQSQVRPEIGYTFASGLRTTLRQDPDIIMVGEIRDKETAQLAVQAALTGHLVFSTIHTNSAIGVIPRLIDMGVDPYLIAPTLALAMAQRLVKRLCPETGKEIPIEGSVKVMVDKQFEDLPKKYHTAIPDSKFLYGLEPSETCPKGTKGRLAVFEVIEMNKEIEQIILTNPTEPAVREAARKQGMLTMREDALI